MAKLEVKFRGLCTLILGEDYDRARVLMPRNERARAAADNGRYTIPVYKPYVAIPVDAKPDVEPDIICDVERNHGQYEVGPFFRGKLTSQELLTARQQRALPSIVENEIRCAVYFIDDCDVRVEALTGDYLHIDMHPVEVDDRPSKDNGSSIFWLAPVDDIVDAGADIGNLTQMGAIPATASASVNITAGEMTCVGLYKNHIWRFIRGNPDFKRSIAAEFKVVGDTGDETSITLVDRAKKTKKRIKFRTAKAEYVFIGNEPLDDLVGTAGRGTCAQPAHDFELQFQFIDPVSGLRPIPVCIAYDDDHRSPPATLCGPPLVTGSGTKGGAA